MKYQVVLVVHDPSDSFSHPAALAETLSSVEGLYGDFELVVSVNRSPHCPRTSEFVSQWCVSRAWARCLLHEELHGTSASFNSGLAPLADDIDAVVLMSADALLIDHSLLLALTDAFDRWPSVGLVHPVSVFEDADMANFSDEWSAAEFVTLFTSLTPQSDPVALDRELTARGERLAHECSSRAPGISGPRAVLPLTFLAMRTTTLSAVGLLDERWSAGYENLDLSLRAYQAGFTSVVVRNAFVMHRRMLFRSLGSYGPAPSGMGSLSGRQAWHDKWGADPRTAWYTLRFGPTRGRLLLAALNAGESNRVLASGIRSVRAGSLRHLGSAVTGMARTLMPKPLRKASRSRVADPDRVSDRRSTR